MNTRANDYRLGLTGFFCLVSSLYLLACTPHNADSKHPLSQAPASNAAPAQLSGRALAFDIHKTELLSGSPRQLYKDGQFIYYFGTDKMFIDGRDYDGFAWSSDYSYANENGSNESEIVQKLHAQQNSTIPDTIVKTRLTYLTPSSGNFTQDFKQPNGLSSAVHYTHTGTFSYSEQKLNMAEKGLANSSLNLNVQTITANTKALPIKPGKPLSFFFSGPNYGKVTLNNKDYETKDVQLLPVDTFNKHIQGTFTDGTAFDIQLHFEQFALGKFEVNIGNGAVQANGSFMISRWIPVADYKIEGTFTDGLKYLSKHTKIEYPYSVYLPPHYATANKTYPVLYLTDGQWVKEYYKMIEAHHKDFIMVAIEQGPENQRMDDFALPGATAYTRFLKEEIIPSIERQYRTNNRRLFCGMSLGGTLGEILLSQESAATPYFASYLLVDGAYWANPSSIREQLKANFAQPKAEAISVFLSGTRQGNYLTNLDFFDRLQGFHNPSLSVKNMELKETHTEMGPPSFEAFIDSLN